MYVPVVVYLLCLAGWMTTQQSVTWPSLFMTQTNTEVVPHHQTVVNSVTRVRSEVDGWACLKRRGLHILHLNVRSLLPKMKEIRDITQRLKPAVFCFTKTWLDRPVPDPEVEIKNYTCVRRGRNRQGGGVAMYIRNGIICDARSDMMCTSNELEAM